MLSEQKCDQRSYSESQNGLARKIRFQQVRDYLWRHPDANLGMISAAFGYMTTLEFECDFKQFSNRTPDQFVSEVSTIRCRIL